jgi:Flp pilus assembly protein TadG
VIRRLRRDERGATLVEFGLLAPVMCMLIVGMLDVAHTLYMRTVLQGAVQRAARDSALETGTEAATRTVIDNKVRAIVRELRADADPKFSRRFYRSYAAASAKTPEYIEADNGNGKCDRGENYRDINRNGVWDADGADDGQGGAKDATLYTVTLTYPRLFPLYGFVGVPRDVTVSASTILRNQPYTDQGSYATWVLKPCP